MLLDTLRADAFRVEGQSHKQKSLIQISDDSHSQRNRTAAKYAEAHIR